MEAPPKITSPGKIQNAGFDQNFKSTHDTPKGDFCSNNCFVSLVSLEFKYSQNC